VDECWRDHGDDRRNDASKRELEECDGEQRACHNIANCLANRAPHVCPRSLWSLVAPVRLTWQSAQILPWYLADEPDTDEIERSNHQEKRLSRILRNWARQQRHGE